jgi:uncharacterized protein YkwD
MTRPALVLLAAACWLGLATAATAQPADLAALRARALDLVNAARQENGLAGLAASATLDEAAQGHAEDMRANDYYAHVSPEGVTPADRIHAAGGSRWTLTAENIARCTGCFMPPDRTTVSDFQDGWMQSPEHRANILNPGLTDFGFGVAGDERSIYAVQTFSGPGSGGGGPEAATVTPEAAAREALEAINDQRQEAGMPPLEPSPELDRAAEAALERLADSDDVGSALPRDIFGLLPEGSSGWRSLALRTARCGGCGTEPAAGDAQDFVEQWAQSGADALGGAEATHLGFALAADGSGRKTAVAFFGG